MSTTLIIGIIFVSICFLYGWSSSVYSRKDQVIETEAGPIEDNCVLERYEMPSKSVKLQDGSYINTHDYIRIIIHGHCMTPRNILSGEEWLVEPINRSKDVKSQLTLKDVLLLYLEDEDIYKIRELRNFEKNGTLATGHYKKDGSFKKSSRNHTLEQVKGIVKYSI